jgi:hypothetical protein
LTVVVEPIEMTAKVLVRDGKIIGNKPLTLFDNQVETVIKRDTLYAFNRTVKFKKKLVLDYITSQNIHIIQHDDLGIKSEADSQDEAINLFSEGFFSMYDHLMTSNEIDLDANQLFTKSFLIAIIDSIN